MADATVTGVTKKNESLIFAWKSVQINFRNKTKNRKTAPNQPGRQPAVRGLVPAGGVIPGSVCTPGSRVPCWVSDAGTLIFLLYEPDQMRYNTVLLYKQERN